MGNLKSANKLYKTAKGTNNISKLKDKKDFDHLERTIHHFLFEKEKPKLKYLYRVYCGNDGFFEKTGCYVKSIDKPKMDIEYVEQVRGNVIRYYPVKYSYPEVSIIYFDSGDSKITHLLESYMGSMFHVSDKGMGYGNFHGRSIMKETGRMIVIEQISTHLGEKRVTDMYGNMNTYSVKSPDSIFYIFYNVQITSIEGDQFDSDDDAGYLVYTLTFKYEYFEIVDVLKKN